MATHSENWSEAGLAWLKSWRSLIHTVNFDGEQISLLAGIFNEGPLRFYEIDKRWM